MKTALLLLFAFVLAAKASAGEKEESFARRLRALYEARDIDGLLSLVEFGEGDTPPMIRDSKRKSFEMVAQSKITSIAVQAVTKEEANDFAAPSGHDGVTFVASLEVVAKVVVEFEGETPPGAAKISSVAQPLGLKAGEYRIVTAMAKKGPGKSPEPRR